jgi:hypothetical protein
MRSTSRRQGRSGRTPDPVRGDGERPVSGMERYGLLLDAQRAALQAGDTALLARLGTEAQAEVERLRHLPLSPKEREAAAALARQANRLARAVDGKLAGLTQELAGVEAELARLQRTQGGAAAPEPLLYDRRV